MADHGVAPKEVAEASDRPSKIDSENGSSAYYIDPVKERRMMRKFDVGILWLWAVGLSAHATTDLFMTT